jgi:nucleotide-binding universal stress UspA family protein
MAGRIERVLCATDFSLNAAAALEAAVAIAQSPGAAILIVHVSPLLVRSAAGVACRQATAPGIDEETRAILVEKLDRFARTAITAGAETRHVLRQGDPGEEIVREAQRACADLIVMGRHRRGLPARWFLGSVSEAVVSRAQCPVMVTGVFPRPRTPSPHRVLCAVDLGETSAATLRSAAALTSALDGDMLVLHVVAGPREAPCAPGPLDEHERSGRTIYDARSRLATLVAGSAPLAGGRVQERVVSGAPHPDILTVGREDEIDIIVVGSHGDGILHRQFIGSTTLHLLRDAECAVLVVPAPVVAETRQSKTQPSESGEA